MTIKHLLLIADRFSVKQRTLYLIVLDGILSSLTLTAAFILRFPLDMALTNITRFWWVIVLGMAIRLGTFQNYGLYTFLWRYASLKELLSVIKAITLSSVFLMGFLFLTKGISFPASILLIDWSLNLIAIGALRIFIRLLRDYMIHQSRISKTQDLKNLLIIGAGDAGEIIAREILRSTQLKYNLVGFVDDKEVKVGQNIHQIPVLGTTEDISVIMKKNKIEEAIIAIPSASGKDIRRIVQMCETEGITCKITPGLGDIIDGKVSVSQLREVRIEDLLGRTVVETDVSEIKDHVTGKTVLITGAGGSIGSELCRQILTFSPRSLIMLDHSECNVYHIDIELQQRNESTTLIPIVADIKNMQRLSKLFQTYKPQVVFHAAAYKHVPLMEDNVEGLIENNILGTQNLILASKEHCAERCIIISTDKAVRPANCMGASKRVGEMVMQLEAENSQTIFAAVRFGNVLGSNGSVVPLFKRQIAAGGPITVTHPDVTRFFMTIPEAVRLVIQAGSFCQGGEIYILDMGEPVKIVTLARDLIHLSGLKEGDDIEIKFVGMRPGEKMYEELSLDREELQPTKNVKIFATQPTRYNHAILREEINDLILNAPLRTIAENRELLHHIASERKFLETVRDR